MTGPSLRARATARAFAGAMESLRRWRERQLGVDFDDITPENAAGLYEEGALQVREVLDRATALSRPVVGVTERRIEGAPVPTWLFTPSEATDGRTVLHLHGGGYVAGSHATHRLLASRIARLADASVVVPDYRLAPEHRHPAALEDSLATLRWLVEDLGVDPARTVVSGDSAGGGLAAATLLAARDRDLPAVAGYVGLSPWVDLTGSGDSITVNHDLDIWLDGRLVAVGGTAYAPDDPTDPYASPLFGDLRGLPPMLVHVGTHEVLLDDSRRFVERARAAGVAASLGEFEGMWHVFQVFQGLPESSRSLREIGGFVRRVTSSPMSAALAASAVR